MTLILAALALSPARAAEPPAELFEAAEAAAAFCRELGGTPAIQPGYQTTVDLNGDGIDDYLTDQANLECDGAFSAFCGSAGCPVTAWLSRDDGGHEPFDFGYLQAVRVILEPGALPAVRAWYHGTSCGEQRAGFEGCSRTWVFATNAPELPGIDPPETSPVPRPQVADAAAPAEATSEATAEEPPDTAPLIRVAPGWTLRDVPGGSPVALGGGTGEIASLAAFCLGGAPFLAVSYAAEAGTEAIRVGFDFSAGAVEVEAGFEESAGGAFVAAMADTPLAARLAGRDSEAAVRVGDRDEGVLSLSGSTRAIRGALAECHDF
jgi:hypothetical protein